MAVSVRQANSGDLANIVDFNRRLAEESEGKILDHDVLTAGVKAALADPYKAIYWMAEVDGQVAGQLSITLEWSDWRNGWLWWIQSVYVRAEFRRRGVFKSLYEHVYSTARAKPDVIGLRLYVEKENHAAQQTYLRMGMSWAEYLVMQKYPL